MFRKKEKVLEGMQYLTTVNNQMELDIIQSLLTSFDISVYIRDAMSGSFIRILMGSSMFDADIFVKKDDYQTAFDALQGDYNDFLPE